VSSLSRTAARLGTFDDASLETGGGQQPLLDPLHLPIVLFVVVAQQVKKAVKRQHPQLSAERVPGFVGLSLRDTGGNGNVAKEGPISNREREDVGCVVLATECAIERPHALIADERDSDFAARARRRRLLEPGRETSRRRKASVGRSDDHC
jgi:hypothetical protein